ncbi:hypothetical protein CC2G_013241 [Coprinopsis cinerea AmutBmut pab1-1]|nr:hypothetical protein CC2G_013241 [Coprinopsis cinerea AmutBmut pab1-1]
MLIPDILHEFDLGVWKHVLIHHLQVLVAVGGNVIQMMNLRYRNIPTFGRQTIRSFGNNVSGMSKLAARDFEDLLQCAIPVFEGLMPRRAENSAVLDLLFVLATWQALAKLRLHTTSTLALLEDATKALGNTLRTYLNKVAAGYQTKELPTEEAARGRRDAARIKKGKGKGRAATAAQGGPKIKHFPLLTYKLHALADYVEAIGRYGTADSWTTQTGECEHKRVKRFYARTNKRKTFGLQIARHEQRHRLLQNIHAREQQHGQQSTTDLSTMLPVEVAQPVDPVLSPAFMPFEAVEPLEKTSPLQHHHVSANDDALNNFIPKLKDHLLRRLTGSEQEEFTWADRDTIQFVGNKVFKHKVLRVNYLTYDLRRMQDSINPHTHANVLLKAPDSDEPTIDDPDTPKYWVAQVVGVYHANIRHVGPASKTRLPQKMEFLWVRWLT